jgi:hypothetical protein
MYLILPVVIVKNFRDKQKCLTIALSGAKRGQWEDSGGDLTNVKYKTI